MASIHCCLSSSSSTGIFSTPRLMCLSATPSWVANCNLKLWAGLRAVAYNGGHSAMPPPLADVACIFCDHHHHHHHHHHLSAQTRRRTHDQHENKSRTRKAQKTGAYTLPIKRKKNKHTRYKNNNYYNYYNYNYAYRKNAEKSTRFVQ